MAYHQEPCPLTSAQIGPAVLLPDIISKHALDGQINPAHSSDSVLDPAHDDESLVSDCESCVSGPSYDQSPSFGNGLIKLDAENKIHDLIKRRFLSCLGSLGAQTKVVSICRNRFQSIMGQARMQSFHIFTRATETKCGGDANVKFAWYATSRDEIPGLVEHGFGNCGEPKNNGLYGHGVYLSPDNSPMECVRNSVVDRDGLRHLLLCRVILGKAEVVHPGSDQSRPSSVEFDSGVSLSSPKKFIIWSTHMNTHILPEFVISFRTPPLRGFVGFPDSLKKPSSPWMPFTALISELLKHLPPSSMRLISKCHRDYAERKISRSELIRQLRRIAGDELLIEVIKSSRVKQFKPLGNFL